MRVIFFLFVWVVFLGWGCSNYSYKFSNSKNLAISEGFVEDFLFLEEKEQIVVIPFYLHHESIKKESVTLGVGDLRLNAIENEHFELHNILVAEVRASLVKYEIQIKIKDNQNVESDKFFELEVYSKSKNKRLKNRITIYLIEDDIDFVVPGNSITVKYLNSLNIMNSKEIGSIGYSKETDCLFVVDKANNSIVKIPYWSNPSLIHKVERLDWKGMGSLIGVLPFSKGFITLVDNGPKQRGEIILVNFDLEILDRQEIGYTPRNPRMSPNEKTIAVPCPGYPSVDYSDDPEGSVYLVEFSKDQTQLKRPYSIDFMGYPFQRHKLSEKGVRLFGPFASIMQDLEPNAVRFSSYSDKLFINFQVNNALAVYDYTSHAFDNIASYGWNDHSVAGYGFDAQKNLPRPFIGSWPIKSIPQPGDICLCDFSEGEIVFTANEGKPRKYETFNETIAFENLNFRGNLENLPYAYQYVDREFLGSLEISSVDGDSNNDGTLDNIIMFGSRSVSAYSPDSIRLLWNSGEQIERYLANSDTYERIFNADENSNEKKSTSNGKGPQPFKIECLQVGNRTYLLVLLKRLGGISIFDVTHPNHKKMVGYINSRSLYQLGGDLEPVDFVLIRNPIANAYTIAVSHSKSSTIGFYKLSF